MIFDTLVWDRTEADADRARYLSRLGQYMSASERTEFLAGLKGAYNYKDWNRIESAVATLAEPLGLSLTTKTDWAATDVWTAAEETRFLNNLAAVTGAFEESKRIPATLDNLSVEAANQIEIGVWQSATGLLWASDGVVYANDGLLRVKKQEAR